MKSLVVNRCQASDQVMRRRILVLPAKQAHLHPVRTRATMTGGYRHRYERIARGTRMNFEDWPDEQGLGAPPSYPAAELRPQADSPRREIACLAGPVLRDRLSASPFGYGCDGLCPPHVPARAQQAPRHEAVGQLEGPED